MDSSLSFPLTEVKEIGELAVNAQVPSELFAGALSEGTLVGPVSVSGVIRRVDEDANFEGFAKGRWRFECTRCLAPVDGEWKEKLDVLVSIDKGPLDLTEDVRQSIALAQPMKVLCKPDCRGFCSVCRKNRNLGDCGHAGGAAESSTRPRLTPRPDKG
ncbi:MAG: YceD family protein [Elusimicrobiota bacterium]